jgi:xylan 1,4-beta-xylosidase
MRTRFHLILLLAFSAPLHAQPVAVTVHADRIVSEIRPIWNFFGYDEAGTTLTSEGRHLLGKLNSLSEEPIRIRVHHLLTTPKMPMAIHAMTGPG